LYKCSFEIRILQKYANAAAKIPHFTRMDFNLPNVEFSVSDEQVYFAPFCCVYAANFAGLLTYEIFFQVPMLLRLYNLSKILSEFSKNTTVEALPESVESDESLGY